ncbi:MAG TPA: FAD-dependent thymidylate synthase [Pseudobdellovibrionaceae bacterium]|jgi:thymidylate synthase (FAD)
MTYENVAFVSLTPNAEETMAYCARVSNVDNQNNPNVAGLLSYCIRHGHWSVFEQANMVLEINTSRAIAPQILRHRSFSFQEFSQRYAEASDFMTFSARRQDQKNRQNSIDDLDSETQNWFTTSQSEIWQIAYAKYLEALKKGIAKECARAFLPLNTSTKLYMNGTIRSWIHYIQLRAQSNTQLEHRNIALLCQRIFKDHLPQVSEALEWK